MRQSSLVEAHVRAILISKKVTKEGEVMPYAQTELTVSGLYLHIYYSTLGARYNALFVCFMSLLVCVQNIFYFSRPA